MTFRVGQKVVCVNDAWIDENWKYIPNRPVRGNVYIIRGLIDYVHGIGVLLEGITNPRFFWDGNQYREGVFPAYRFRPVVDRKTDISIFTEILDRENAKRKQQREKVSDHQ